MTLYKLSRCRQKVHRLSLRRQSLEQIALERHPMIAGSLVERRFRPGAPVAYYLSIPTPENSWHRYIRKDELVHYRARAQAWRQFVHAMAELVIVNKTIEKELRALGRERCEKITIRRRR